MADYDEIARRVDAFTSGNDPNPGGMFPTGSYLTPDEAREQGVGWVARPGEPQDLNHPYHYQTPDQARANGINWATQPVFLGGRGPAEHQATQRMAQAARPGTPQWDALQGYGYDNYQAPVRQATVPLGALLQRATQSAAQPAQDPTDAWYADDRARVGWLLAMARARRPA